MSEPKFLIIDDEDIEWILPEYKAVRRRLPTADDLPELAKWADVILCDFKIVDEAADSLQAKNGIALVARLRAEIEGINLNADLRLKAFALMSKLLDNVSTLPKYYRNYAAARELNVSWLFDNVASKDGHERLSAQLFSLGLEVIRLSSLVHEAGPDPIAVLAMEIKRDEPWTVRALEEVRAAMPLMRGVTRSKHLYVTLRWLLLEVGPFPGLIYEDAYLAARLRVDPERLNDVLALAVGKSLAVAQYFGVGSQFFTRRWWGGAIEQLLWDLTDQNPYDSAALEKLTEGLGRTDNAELVVPLDENYQPSSKLAQVSDCIGILPAGWPATAQRAWMLKSLADDIGEPEGEPALVRSL